jgi:hypothetical protein
MSEFSYSPWRHGGWYVNNVRYPSGAVGCVSRNYEDKKWRIACDPRPFEQRPTFKSRDEAARAERELIKDALIEQMAGALNFILAFYEPQSYLDTNAWTQAEAGGRRALKAAKDAGYFGGNVSQAAPECTPHEPSASQQH